MQCSVIREIKELRCCSRLRSCVSSTTNNAAADELCCKLQTRYSKSCPLDSCCMTFVSYAIAWTATSSNWSRSSGLPALYQQVRQLNIFHSHKVLLLILVFKSATYYLFFANAIPEVVVVSVLVAGWCKHCVCIKCLVVRCRLRRLNTWKLCEISANQTKCKPVFVVEQLSTDRCRTRCLPGAVISMGRV